MDREPTSERIIIPLTPSMVEAIKDYWHEHRFDSRSEAIRRLLEYALEKQPPPKATAKRKT
jgi:Arc/MetJ-type ribon-helix-helix transcriptional regulator